MLHDAQVQGQVPIDYVLRQSRFIPAGALREYADHRLYFALRRFADQVRRVTVRVIDENGPRRGIDTKCLITAEFHHGPPLVVEAISAWPTASVTAAARRLTDAIRRRLDRGDRRRRAPAR
jgi:hypothetical protein